VQREVGGPIPGVDDSAVAVTQILDRRDLGRQGLARVRHCVRPLGGRIAGNTDHSVRRATPGQVLMAVDETGKQRRLGTVVDDLGAIRRRLDPTYLDDATAVTD